MMDRTYIVSPAALEIAQAAAVSFECKVVVACLYDMVTEHGWRSYGLNEIFEYVKKNGRQSFGTGGPVWVFRHYRPRLIEIGVLIEECI